MTSIDKALQDKRLLGNALGDPSSWSMWLDCLRAFYGRPLDDPKAFAEVTGGRSLPGKPMRELWCILGRSSGKSRIAGALAVYSALFVEHKLAPGEVGYVLTLSVTKDQARLVFGYALGFLQSSPALAKEIASTTTTEIRLRSGVVITTHAASFRSIRGRTMLAVILDEIALWRQEDAAASDLEVYRAIVPALARTRGVLIGISTPYMRGGLLFDKHRKFFGTDDPNVLVVQSPTIAFNPTIDQDAIAAALIDDPESARAEWNAEWRSDISAFLDDILIERAVDLHRPLELPPRQDIKYRAFADPGGGQHDHFTIAVAHTEDERTIIDLVRGAAAPYDPHEVVREFADLIRQYGIREITSDFYSAQWAETTWTASGIKFNRSKLNRSELYIEMLPLFTRGAIAIPDHARLRKELRLLERRTSRLGKDAVDHPKRGSDDYANALAGAARLPTVMFAPAPKFYRILDLAGNLEEIKQDEIAPNGGSESYLQNWNNQIQAEAESRARVDALPSSSKIARAKRWVS
jgi:hypothetical protein